MLATSQICKLAGCSVLHRRSRSVFSVAGFCSRSKGGTRSVLGGHRRGRCMFQRASSWQLSLFGSPPAQEAPLGARCLDSCLGALRVCAGRDYWLSPLSPSDTAGIAFLCGVACGSAPPALVLCVCHGCASLHQCNASSKKGKLFCNASSLLEMHMKNICRT